jgi:hypothetical protein
MLAAIYLDHVLRRAHVTPLSRPLVSVLNRGAAFLDRNVELLREPRPGTISANYHVVAVKPA